jgi:hypothetical protein
MLMSTEARITSPDVCSAALMGWIAGVLALVGATEFHADEMGLTHLGSMVPVPGGD